MYNCLLYDSEEKNIVCLRYGLNYRQYVSGVMFLSECADRVAVAVQG
jgi:hypothetical protein